MKKLLITLFLALVLAFSVFAAPPRIVDQADLLTAAEIQKLEVMAEQIADTYSMDAVIVTVDSLSGKTAQAYADDYFDSNGYGQGDDYSGILLLIAMNDREWAVSTCGSAMDVIRDSEIDEITADITDELSDGDFYQAFYDFLDFVDAEYSLYGSGADTGGFSFVNVIIALVIGAAAAGITLLIMRAKMNTAREQHGAGSYMCDGSYDLFRCHDIYLYSHTSKTRKPQSSSSGGGSHRSSFGRSHGGRSGRF